MSTRNVRARDDHGGVEPSSSDEDAQMPEGETSGGAAGQAPAGVSAGVAAGEQPARAGGGSPVAGESPSEP